MRLVLLLLLSSFLLTCSRPDRQDIDLSDAIIEVPADGIGHYIYAASLPKTVAPGEKIDVQMEWRTVGPVDPTARYGMEVIISGGKEIIHNIRENENTVGEHHLSNWLSYDLAVPGDFPTGNYTVGVRLRNRDGEIVPLGYEDSQRMSQEGFYRIGEVAVQ